jgi:hypothetical protein
MHPPSRILAVLALLLLAVTAGAQTRPDFSGPWSQVEPQLGPNDRHVEQIELRDSTLKITADIRSQGGPGGMVSHDDHTYTIGGPTETSKDKDGRVRSLTVSWDGPALVFVRTTLEGANTTTERTVWTLSDDGTRLTRARETTDWKGTTRDRRVLQRQ